MKLPKKIPIYFAISIVCFTIKPFALLSQPLFSPSSISGLKFWINADNVKSSTFPTIDTAIDISGNNNNAYAPSPASKPFIKTSILNNHKVFGFDGIDDFFNFSVIKGIRTVFWIIKENPSASSNYRCLLGSSTDYDFFRGASKEIWHNSYANNAIKTGMTSINSYTVNGTSTLVPTQFSLISLVTTDSVKANSFSYDRGNSGREWDGDLAELIIYNKALNQSELDSIENYLYTKYAPPINIGPTKFVCSLPYTIKAKKDWFTNYSWQNGSTADSLVVSIPGTYSITVTNIFGKTSSSSITIFVDNTNFNASLGNDTVMCKGKTLLLTAGPEQYQYLWSNGATQNTVSISSTATLSVSVTNCLGNNSSDNIKINYPNYNLLDSVFCTSKTIQWNTNHPKNQFSFLWNNATTDSILNISTPGQYYVEIYNNKGCVINSNTVTVTEDNFSTTASLGPDLSLCSGNSIALTSGATPSLTYTWSDGSHNNSLVINTTGPYSVVVTNTNSCVAKDTINITIAGQAPAANFSHNAGCKNNAVSFVNLSSAPISNTITSSLWNFGDPLSASNTSTLSNPFHTFSDTGNYTIKLKVITNVGCEQTVLKTIHIAPTPTVNFSNSISCQNDTTKFTSLISSPSYSISNWLWNFGDAISGASNISSVANPKHVFSNQTNYSVKLVAINNAGCKDSISKNVNVKAQVKALFSYSAACTNEVVRFKDNSIVSAPASSTVRNWSFGVSTTNTLVSQYYPLAGTYPVTLTVIGTNGCVSYATKQVTVTIPPACNFVTPQNFCINDSIKLIDASISSASAIQNWKWTVNTTPYSTLQSPFLHVIDSANHIVKLRVIDGLGCKDSTSKSVYVYSLPIVDFTPSPNFIFSQTSATLTPNILTGLAYNWTGTNGFSSSLTSPIYQFGDTGNYQITLLLTNNRGCKNSKTKSFIVYNRRTDLAILDITPSIQPDGYLDLTASLANFGTTTITNFKINYKLTNGGQIKENWSGVLNAGIFYNYNFSGSSLVNEADKNSIICVTITQVNGGLDDNIQNNNQCSALFVKDVDIFSPYPNPTNNDIIFPIVLKKETNIMFDITNAFGSSILATDSVVGNAGLNLIPFSVSNLASGCYIVKITINDKIFIKKIIKY